MTSSIERRKRNKKKKKHFLMRFIVLIIIIAGCLFFLNTELFNIQNIEVEGNIYYSKEEVIEMAAVPLNKNIFWGVEKSKIIDNLEQNPYFREVKFKYKLPNTIIIDISEREQFAAAAYGEEYIVVDKEGYYLRLTDVRPELPLIKNMTFTNLELGEEVECENKLQFVQSLQVVEAMEQGEIFAKEIEISEVYISCYIYDDLICRGTPTQLITTVQNGTINKVLSDLFSKGIKKGTLTIGNNLSVSFSPEI